jgi:tRNA-guanine family transglycosylase
MSIVNYRTTRWLDRCLKAHKKPDSQNVFPIVQGTLYDDLREQSAKDHIQRDVRGFAIGGLRYVNFVYIIYTKFKLNLI